MPDPFRPSQSSLTQRPIRTSARLSRLAHRRLEPPLRQLDDEGAVRRSGGSASSAPSPPASACGRNGIRASAAKWRAPGTLRPQARTKGRSPRYWWNQIVAAGFERVDDPGGEPRFRLGERARAGVFGVAAPRRPAASRELKLRLRSTPSPFSREPAAAPSGFRLGDQVDVGARVGAAAGQRLDRAGAALVAVDAAEDEQLAAPPRIAELVRLRSAVPAAEWLTTALRRQQVARSRAASGRRRGSRRRCPAARGRARGGRGLRARASITRYTA